MPPIMYRRQEQEMALRIVGVDIPDPAQGFVSPVGGNQQPFRVNAVQDTTAQNLQKADQAVLKGFDTLAQQTEVVSKSAAQGHQIEAERLATQGNAFFQLATVAGQAFDKYQKIEATRQQNQQKQYEKQQDEEYVNATQSMQDAMFGLRSYVKQQGYEKGIVNARERVTTILKQHPNLTPEARRALAKEAYKQLDDLDFYFFKQSDEQHQDIKRQQVGTLEFDTRIKLSRLTARLEFSTTSKPEEVQQVLDQAETEIIKAAKEANFDPLQTATFHASMMKQLASVLENNAGAREQALERQNRAVEWLNRVSVIANDETIAPDIKETLLAPINEYYGYAWNKRPISQTDVMKEAAERMQLGLQLNELAKQQYLKFEDVPQIEDALVTEQALALYNDPSLIWKYKDDQTIDSQRIQERAKQFKEVIPKIRAEQAQETALKRQIAEAQARLGMIEQYVGMDVITLKKMGISVPNTNEINELRTKIDGLEAQRQQQASLIQSLAAPLQQAGLTFDGEGKVYMDAALMGKVNNARQLIKDKQPQVNFNGGSSGSPIKPKPLMKSEAGYLVPFAPGTSAPVTSNYGMRPHPVSGGVKMHRGVDFGAPRGASVASVKHGRVVRAGWLDGYGNTVEVEHSDGVTTLYAHLSKIDVKQGQLVGQGAIVGRVGNTGVGTGDHLHFGAYKGKSESDSIDPMAYLRSLKLENAAPQSPTRGTTRGLGLPPNQSVRMPSQGESSVSSAIGNRESEMTISGTGGSVMRAEESMPQGAIGLPTGGYIWEGKVYLPNSLYESNRRSMERIRVTTQSSGVSSPSGVSEQPQESDTKTVYRSTGKPYVRLSKGDNGLELQLVDAKGVVIDRVSAVSGRPNKQNFRTTKDSQSGSEEPVPEGVFSLGAMERGDFGNPALGNLWIPVNGTGNRSAIGVHVDGDRDTKPGTEGCIALVSQADAERVAKWMSSKAKPGQMVVDYGLGTLGKEYERISAPTRYLNSGNVSSQFNRARPIPNALASNSLKDYNGRNDPKANYGYAVLAKDAQFARAVAGVADRLGIPAQWLVDVMAFETGGTFSPGISNGAGSGATGLIQFMPDTARGLGTSTGALAGMTRTQQLRYVEKYFQQGIQEVGKFKRMDDVFAYIWGGGGLVRKSDAQRIGWDDGSIRYQDYLRQIGSHVGRAYHTGLDRLDKSGRTHTSYKDGCPTCAQMRQSLGHIIAHRAGR